MSARNSPDPASQLVVFGDEDGGAPVVANGHRSPNATGKDQGQASPVPSIEGDAGTLPDAPARKEQVANGGDDDANSEAETLIDSPVKKKEAEKQKQHAIKTEKPQKNRIGSLPVPGDDDEDGDSNTSALESREVSVGKGTSLGDAKEDVDMLDDDSDKENGSELSSARSSPSNGNSRASSRSRALSEIPQDVRNGASGSPNPRKRKHRASSMSLPSSKRQSMDPPKRTRLRGMHSEDIAGRTSLSPKRGHRRAVSTQSALDGATESGSRKRKGASSTYPGRESSKSARANWEESDASSETTSRGHDEGKRPQRGVGRSTSTPGRPGGREHKRHVNKYGFTRLAEACEDANLPLVKELLEKDPEAIEVPEFAGNKPLQIAALNGNAEVVSYLIEQGCQIDSANLDKDTPLIDAAENGHLETVEILLKAGVDPMRQNLKGQQALDVVTDDTDDAPEIRAALHRAIDQWNSSEAKQRREEEEEQRHRAGPSKELHLMARTYENLMRLVQINDRNGVSEFLAARVPVDNGIITAAAKTGDLYLLNMLFAEMPEKKAGQKSDKPMLGVLGSSHFEMVKSLTQLYNFNPLYRNRNGKSWPEIAEERNGPMWKQEKELLQQLYDDARSVKQRRSSSPVTKRDGAKRRLQPPEPEDDSDEEEGTRQRSKKKNGRRLMSRKDMRAAGSKGTMSESSDEDAEGEPDVPITAEPEAKEEGDTEMKPPESPNTRRRTRSKSISSQPEVSPKSLRKRSNSTRDVAEKAMPTLDEKGEEKDSGSDGIVLGDVQDPKKHKGDAAKLALDEAKRLDEQRKKAEEAEVEAKRVEEELKKKQEEERKAEEEKKAAEAKAAAEARKREEEAERVRKAEEERVRREQEMVEAKAKFQSQLLEVLPTPFSHVLDPESGFLFESDADREFLLRQFTPLLALGGSPSSTIDNVHVLNLQAAPLLGKIGLELFGSGSQLVTSSLLDSWTTEPVNWSEQPIDRILSRTDWSPAPAFTDGDEEMLDADLPYEEELKKATERYNAFVGARELLRDSVYKFGLRRVRLADVMENLHPLLKDSPIDIEFFQPPLSNLDRLVRSEAPLKQDFVQSMRDSWSGGAFRPNVEVLSGKVEVPATAAIGSLTDVVVVHEKRP